ncbi:MAG TPA: 16S rRNA (cytidine(1402)-2'-O)-methyltransferase [Kiritimatiellae bacterium]|nr:16S rRNA (cytidine(1402)-2'-O)-methyltransferase [Kiritimatiellia bacterium]
MSGTTGRESRQSQEQALAPGLYLVGTPIGNLEDITLRALRILRSVDLVMAEDTRRTRNLLSHFNIHVRLVSCHRFNEAQRAERVVREVGRGRAVALVTDAGMPGVSDPGSRVAVECRRAGVPVTVVPGPCAVLAALVLSGEGGGAFFFAGFLPRKGARRKAELLMLLRMECPCVIFEAPHRFFRLLGDIERLDPQRRLFIAREMTKRHEECYEGTATDVRRQMAAGTVRGEFTVVIGRAQYRGGGGKRG